MESMTALSFFSCWLVKQSFPQIDWSEQFIDTLVSNLVELKGIVERSTAKEQNIAQLIEAPEEEKVVFLGSGLRTYHNYSKPSQV